MQEWVNIFLKKRVFEKYFKVERYKVVAGYLRPHKVMEEKVSLTSQYF